MSANEKLADIFGTLLCGAIAIICGAFIPLKIINSDSHTLIEEIGNFRFIGPAFILIGIIGNLACYWDFVFDAKGAPLIEGMQKHLIVKGLYKHVRNPIYISWSLSFLGRQSTSNLRICCIISYAGWFSFKSGLFFVKNLI